ncbi:TRAP transporter substrate-binding protein [Ferrovibrio sp. MS7]|jgi:TRAP-type C4-dicarboxylate transport system substrate-binding protein|uniref:TRAP transporter substrate-binding protein n=1 Tax=Ferrovibrio TaxID=1231242 RepID=UPI0031372822
MGIGRRRFLTLAGAAAVASPLVGSPMVIRNARAQAQVTLKLHHFLPAVSNVHTKLWTPWAKKLEAESGGRLKVDIFPAMQLGGAPPQLFDQARDGVADLVWTLPGNTPGRFPGVEVFELPFVAAKRGIANAQATQEFYETYLREEFKEVHPIVVWSHDGGLIHASKPVKTMEDLKGMKLRSPTRFAGEALKALGATGIPMPIPQLPEALAQKVLDGCVIPWEVVPAVKVHELVKNHIEIPGSPTLYTATFILAMNKAKYASLPADLKQILDANSGQALAKLAGEMWDNEGVAVADMVRKRSNSITAISADEAARWRKATQPVIDDWIKAMKDKGVDGGKMLEHARALVAKYDKA